MDKDGYLTAFHENRNAIICAAERGFEPLVAACAPWNVGVLTAHMGGVFTFWNKWLRQRPKGHDENSPAELAAEREELLPGYGAWREAGFPADQAPAGVIEFARRAGDEMEERLRALDPSEPVWTFFQPDQMAGFIQRRIAHETAIHRWDAEHAHGIDKPIETELARDGIDEYLNMALSLGGPPAPKPGSLPRTGQRFQFLETGGGAEWNVKFDPEETRVQPGGHDAQVTLSGTASDLDLFVWGRVGPEALSLEGDLAMAAQWKELTGGF